MERGDLDNRSVQMRVIFIWDGLLAHLTHATREALCLRTHAYRLAFECWEPDDHYEAVVKDYTMRHDVRVDVVTHHPSYVSFIEKRYDMLNLGVANVWWMSPSSLARRASSMGDVHTIFFPSQTSFDLMYGPKGSPIIVRPT